MCSVLNTLSEYTYFYIWIKITSFIFLLVFKIVESLQSILKVIKTELYLCNPPYFGVYYWTFLISGGNDNPVKKQYTPF